MGRTARNCAALLLAVICGPVAALQFSLPPNARETAARDSVLEQVSLPVGPFAAGALPTRIIEGPVQRRAYRISTGGLTPLQIVAPLRDQLAAAGYDVLLDCADVHCGGFDFRFSTEVLPAPNMFVNIRAFHVISALHPDTGTAVSVIGSTAAGAAYLQIVQVGEDVEAPAPAPAAPLPVDPVTKADLTAQLLQSGSVVLDSLDFAVGTTALADPDTPELAALAALLETRPGLQIALVGHTDTVGALEANISVSRARAQAVRDALITQYGANPDRIEAEGMGYLSPVATNLTPEGREANRRVEVIVVRENDPN